MYYRNPQLLFGQPKLNPVFAGVTHAWPFNETADTSMRRESLGSGLDFFPQGVTTVSGMTKLSGGTNSYLAAPTTNPGVGYSLNTNEAFTWCFLIKPSSLSGTEDLLSKGETIYPVDAEYRVYLNGSTLTFRLYYESTSGVFTYVERTATITNGADNIVFIVFDPANDIISVKVNSAAPLTTAHAAAGKVRYLTQATITTTVANSYALWDVVWVNSGLSVTTTTGQTINSVAFPARDNNGTTNGEGYMIGVYAVAALGNAALVSNSTITYTNSAGTGSRTATLSAVNPNNFPATPVIGTVVWFELQAGDIGVQSIQTVTLNTTLTSGTASVFVARKLIDISAPAVNVNFKNELNAGNGVVLYDNACILPFVQSAATTAHSIQGTVTTIER